MTSTIGITINVVLDVFILGLLAFVMSRASKLTPHRAAAPRPRVAPVAQAPRVRVRRRHEPSSSKLHPVLG